MNTYPTSSQATGVARTLSKRIPCTIVVYQTAERKFVTARSNDRVSGLIQGVYRDGYLLPPSHRPE
jgi:hypothetical protein